MADSRRGRTGSRAGPAARCRTATAPCNCPCPAISRTRSTQTQASRRRPRLARPRSKQSGAERIRTAATDKYEVIDHETRAACREDTRHQARERLDLETHHRGDRRHVAHSPGGRVAWSDEAPEVPCREGWESVWAIRGRKADAQ